MFQNKGGVIACSLGAEIFSPFETTDTKPCIT